MQSRSDVQSNTESIHRDDEMVNTQNQTSHHYPRFCIDEIAIEMDIEPDVPVHTKFANNGMKPTKFIAAVNDTNQNSHIKNSQKNSFQNSSNSYKNQQNISIKPNIEESRIFTDQKGIT